MSGFAMSKDEQGSETLIVAYLGPEASFSHQAAIEVFQSASSSVSLRPLPSFSAIFSSIQNSSASSEPQISYDYAVIPIENSTNGSVVQVLDLIAQCGLDSTAPYPDLEVCGEYYLPVHHCLFVAPSPAGDPDDGGHSSKTPSDDAKQSIRTLYSHPQVWGQCGRFLSAHFPPNVVERIDVGSTSAAAQLVAREANGGLSAAIGSKLAGEKNSLVCLAENIEDEPGQNTTRFFVVRNRKRTTVDALFPGSRRHGDAQYKSLITFTIPHTKPGSLAEVLAVFKQFSFNLTSIDTRPGRKRNWQYVFFVECEETFSAPNTSGTRDSRDAKNLMAMLHELGRFTESLRYLGRFVDQLQLEDGTGTAS